MSRKKKFNQSKKLRPKSVAINMWQVLEDSYDWLNEPELADLEFDYDTVYDALVDQYNLLIDEIEAEDDEWLLVEDHLWREILLSRSLATVFRPHQQDVQKRLMALRTRWEKEERADDALNATLVLNFMANNLELFLGHSFIWALWFEKAEYALEELYLADEEDEDEDDYEYEYELDEETRVWFDNYLAPFSHERQPEEIIKQHYLSLLPNMAPKGCATHIPFVGRMLKTFYEDSFTHYVPLYLRGKVSLSLFPTEVREQCACLLEEIGDLTLADELLKRNLLKLKVQDYLKKTQSIHDWVTLLENELYKLDSNQRPDAYPKPLQKSLTAVLSSVLTKIKGYEGDGFPFVAELLIGETLFDEELLMDVLLEDVDEEEDDTDS
jgi:hypothetical protein